MTTKTDFHAIQELREKYAPKVRGIVSGEEAKAIYEVLEIDKRNNIELQNIRDMVVMIYGQWFDKSRDQYLEDKKKGVQAVDKSAEYLGRAVSKSFSPSVIIPGGAVMENKYVSFEVYRPVKSPTEKGEYMGKTPNLEQARRAADAVGGALYGITSDGRKVLLL